MRRDPVGIISNRILLVQIILRLFNVGILTESRGQLDLGWFTDTVRWIWVLMSLDPDLSALLTWANIRPFFKRRSSLSLYLCGRVSA